MARITKIVFVALLVTSLLSSCIRNYKNPGREYMPDMAHSTAYDASTLNPVFKDSVTNQKAPAGSIGRGKFIYSIANTPEGYELAGSTVKNPFVFSKEEIEGEGKKLYTVNCAICHGTEGDGNGHLPSIDKFPQPPSYFGDALANLPEGKMYHSVMYGKGMMGSYASQIDHRERWLVISYVRSMQNAKKGAGASPVSDTTKISK